MENSFLCGIAIGLIFGMPIGTVGMMTVQKTLHYGIKAGFLTGLGSSAADCLYACVGVFGFTLISDFMLNYQLWINLLGGLLILFLGIRLLQKEQHYGANPFRAENAVCLFASSFAVGITNPAAILTFLFAFSYFGLSNQMEPVKAIELVAGVFIGTYFWWGSLSVGVSMLKKRVTIQNPHQMNRIFGMIFILFAMAIFAKVFFPF